VTSEPTVNDVAFWQSIYARKRDGWELGRPSPSLDVHLARHPLPAATVAVPGCGRGHDARLLARRGHRVFAFDFAPEALRAARELAAPEDAA
jgi:thiopurine S-methyltransferase